MEPFPHHYRVAANGKPTGSLTCQNEHGVDLPVNSPRQFGGEGEDWSPEHLLSASVVSCFMLTFRAVAAASRLDWSSIACDIEGTLDKVERKMAFTGFKLGVTLTVPPGADEERALKALAKAEANCLVTNSLSCPVHLEPRLLFDG